MLLVKNNNRFEMWECPFEDWKVPNEAGFWWDKENKVWYTLNATNASKLYKYACAEVQHELRDMLPPDSLASVVMTIGSRQASANIDLAVPIGLSYKPYQVAGIQYMLERPHSLMADVMGLGKAQPVSEPVATPTGWRKMGDLKVGDYVMGANGKPTQVIGVFPQGQREIWNVRFSDGSQTFCDPSHLWTVQQGPRGPWRNVTLRDLKHRGLRYANGNAKYRIPITQPVEFEARSHEIDPYVLGCLLGDGGFSNQSVYLSNVDEKLRDKFADRLPASVSLKHVSKGDYRVSCGKPGGYNAILDALKTYGLHGKKSAEKFIPCFYMVSSIKQRQDLLSGLLDTDGYVAADGTIQYSSSSQVLRDQVVELVQSLGGVARKSDKIACNDKPHYMTTINLPEGWQPFTCVAKAERMKTERKYLPSRLMVDADFSHHEEAVCIKVAAEDELYLTRDYVVTHNTIQAIGWVNNSPDISCDSQILLMCPATLKRNWQREFRKWLTKQLSVSIANKDIPNTNIVIMNYDQLACGETQNYTVEKVKVTYHLDKVIIEQPTGAIKISPAPGKTLRETIENYDYDTLKLVSEDKNGRLSVVKMTTFAKKFIGRFKTFIEHWEFVQKVLAVHWSAIIADEGHKCKNPDSKRSKNFFKLKATRRIVMTGTPIMNRPAEIFHLVNFIDNTVFEGMDFHKFAQRYCAAYRGIHGWVTTGASRMPELQNLLRTTIMIRRSKQEVLKDLPPKIRQVIPLPADSVEGGTRLLKMEVETKAKYQSLLDDLQALVESHGETKDDEGFRDAVKALGEAKKAAFEEMAKVRKETAIAKAPVIAAMIREQLDEDPEHKIIVFAHHRDVCKIFQESMGDERSVMLIGGMSDNNKDAVIERFQTDPACQLFVASMKAAGEGITLTASDHEIFAEEDWVPATMLQCEDRAHRIGATGERVLVQHMVLEDSLDLHIANTVVEKMNIIDQALDTMGVDEETSGASAIEAMGIRTKQTAESPKKFPRLTMAQVRDLQMVCKHIQAQRVWQTYDVRFGAILAETEHWTSRQVDSAFRLLQKYKRYMTSEVWHHIYSYQQPTESAS